MTAIAALRRKLSGYLPASRLEDINAAYKYSESAHAGQKRASGKPFIMHPLTVADILADWRFDTPSIVAALLHDVVEDTPVTLEQIEQTFGKEISGLVDGLSKIARMEGIDREENEAENFRKLLLAASIDLRVIFIKLADRLHNMRTLSAIQNTARRRAIAAETITIYAPISDRLGSSKVRDELQNLAFAHLHPYRHRILTKALKQSAANSRPAIGRIEEQIRKRLNDIGLKHAAIETRKKNLYSIHQKMESKSLSFAQVEDIIGFRIIVAERMECYLAMGAMHESFVPTPSRFKDYIAIPKSNGYQSLHTTVMSPTGIRVELQIRTRSMHEVAEHGLAAHWIYKQQGAVMDETQREALARLTSLVNIHTENKTPSEFMEHIKVDLSPAEMYVITPKGKVITLPHGSTALDFAYAIHSDVGDKAERAIINGQKMPIGARLNTGDQVAIETHPDISPLPHWLNYAKTARSRSRIRNRINAASRESTALLGEKLLNKSLAQLSAKPEDIGETDLRNYLKSNNMKTKTDLHFAIGIGKMIPDIAARELTRRETGRSKADAPLLIAGSGNAAIKLSPCCNPLPFEPIIGVLKKDQGLVIHSSLCPTVPQLNRRSQKWIEVAWHETPGKSLYAAAVILECRNRPGLMTEISAAISRRAVNIVNLKFEGGTSKASAINLEMIVEVPNKTALDALLENLQKMPEVLRARRHMREEQPRS